MNGYILVLYMILSLHKREDLHIDLARCAENLRSQTSMSNMLIDGDGLYNVAQFTHGWMRKRVRSSSDGWGGASPPGRFL